MFPKRIYKSASLLHPSSLRRLHQEKSYRTAKTRIERQPLFFDYDISIRHQYRYSNQIRWFSDSSDGDDTADSSIRQTNAFRLFSFPLSFKIDEELLRTKYHDYMKLLHPDKQNSESNSKKSDDPDDPTVAAAITNAYNVLKRPHLRAMHLLKIMKSAPNDPASHLDDGDDHSNHLTDPSKDFLLEVMDLQELIHDLDTDEHLKPYFDDNVQRIQDTCKRLQEAFETSNIIEFQNLAIKLKYWTRIDETLRKKMTNLE
jgi:molecular chaperone HscB